MPKRGFYVGRASGGVFWRPKSAPRGTKRAPKSRQKRPKSRQDGPKSATRAAKRAPRAAKTTPRGPKSHQEALQRPPGAIFGSILEPPGIIFVAFGFSKQFRETREIYRRITRLPENTRDLRQEHQTSAATQGAHGCTNCFFRLRFPFSRKTGFGPGEGTTEGGYLHD